MQDHTDDANVPEERVYDLDAMRRERESAGRGARMGYVSAVLGGDTFVLPAQPPAIWTTAIGEFESAVAAARKVGVDPTNPTDVAGFPPLRKAEMRIAAAAEAIGGPELALRSTVLDLMMDLNDIWTMDPKSAGSSDSSTSGGASSQPISGASTPPTLPSASGR